MLMGVEIVGEKAFLTQRSVAMFISKLIADDSIKYVVIAKCIQLLMGRYLPIYFIQSK